MVLQIVFPHSKHMTTICIYWVYFKQILLVNEQLRHVLGLWLSALHPCLEPGGVFSAPSHPLDMRLLRLCPHLPSPLSPPPPRHLPTTSQSPPSIRMPGEQTLLDFHFLKVRSLESQTGRVSWGRWERWRGGRQRDGGAVLCLLSNQSQYCSQRVNQHTRLAISKK